MECINRKIVVALRYLHVRLTACAPFRPVPSLKTFFVSGIICSATSAKKWNRRLSMNLAPGTYTYNSFMTVIYTSLYFFFLCILVKTFLARKFPTVLPIRKQKYIPVRYCIVKLWRHEMFNITNRLEMQVNKNKEGRENVNGQV